MIKIENLFVAPKEELDEVKEGASSANKKNLSKYLLRDINIEVGKNEIHSILGKNGSGKSTLAFALMGLDSRIEIKKGKIIFGGKDITAQKPFERARLGLAMAFQEPARFEGLSVEEFLFLSLKLRGQDSFGQKQKEEIEEILEWVGLERKFAKRKLDEKLSGGERKRIELASVILMKPKVMILDEPDASLDIIVYNELYDILLKTKEQIGCSIILITHREEAGLIADKATLIESGVVVESGPFRKVMRTYCQREGRKERCYEMKAFLRKKSNN